tara:strand:+ start:349 stop:1755 length:1407 start_codon:yes stop_codon:yes gene_type:complete
MVNIELVGSPADGSGSSGQFHAAEYINALRAINGHGVLGHTITATITGSSLVVTIPAFVAVIPDGSGGSTRVSHAGGTITHDAADGTNPRLDVGVVDASGNLEARKGTATAVADATTKNSGTGSITSGGTTDVITHGLTSAPTLEDIFITLGENPTNTPGAIWVDTIGATTFTVNCENDPGASNLDFAWQAEALTSAPIEAPMPSINSDDVMLYKVVIGAGVTAITSSDIHGRAIDISERGEFITPLAVADGSVSAPSFQFDSDPNSGLYWVGADKWGVVAGGVKIVEWELSSGAGKVRIFAPSTNPGLRFYEVATAMWEWYYDVTNNRMALFNDVLNKDAIRVADASGSDIVLDGTLTQSSFDDYDDLALLNAITDGRAALREYSEPLEKIGVWQYDEDRRTPYMSIQGMTALQIGALRQENRRAVASELAMTDELRRLRGGVEAMLSALPAKTRDEAMALLGEGAK